MEKQSINPMVYAALYLNKKSASEKVSFAQSIAISMSANVNFTNPIPSMPELQAGIDALALAIASYEAVKSDSKLNDLLVKEGDLDVLLIRLKEYAENVANNGTDAETATSILLTGGFPIAKSRSKTPVPNPVTTIFTQQTNITGTVDVNWKGVKNARSYQLMVSTTDSPSANWQVAAVTTARKARAENLTPNTRYYFMVIAVGVNGNSMPGTVASGIAS